MPTLKISLGITWSRGKMASALLPRSRIILSRVTFLTTPEIISPSCSRYASTINARSASRTFCTSTCLAVWAAIRPKSTESIFSSITSPSCALGSFSLASSTVNSAAGLT